MAIQTVFPAGAPRPGGVVLNPGEKLNFTLSTDSPAPAFTFSVDAVLLRDQRTAARRTTSALNIFSWSHPSGTTGHNQLQDLLLKVLILSTETYDYVIEKVDAAGAVTKLLEESMTGAGSVERSDFMLGLQ